MLEKFVKVSAIAFGMRTIFSLHNAVSRLVVRSLSCKYRKQLLSVPSIQQAVDVALAFPIIERPTQSLDFLSRY